MKGSKGWDSFREHRVHKKREKTDTLKEEKIPKEKKRLLRRASEESWEKEQSLRNAISTSSLPERHYPKSFTIPKKEDT